MKKVVILLTLCCLAVWLAACGAESEPESGAPAEAAQTEETAEDTSEEQSEAAPLTPDQALAAVRTYCIAGNPELEAMAESEDYTVFWEVEGADADEIVILFRSYTGSETRYYIDPVSGETHVTESVPGITEGEQPTDETLNARAYLYQYTAE